MKKIFAILYCLPPILVPATVRYLKWFKGLDELGYNIIAFSINPDSFDPPSPIIKDSYLNQLIPNSIINETVWSLEKNRILKAIKETRIGYKIFYRFFEPRKREWYYSAIRFLRKSNLNNFDVILSSSKPNSSHLVGIYLKKKTKKPWIAYFSDPWVDNSYASYRNKKIYNYNLALEKEVVESADIVLFSTQETLNLVGNKYQSNFKEKAWVVPHSFVPEWYELSHSNKFNKIYGKIRVVHTGHFYGPRTPMPLLKNLIILKREIKNISEKIEFLFFGNMTQEYKNFIDRNMLDDIVSVYETVPYIQSLELIKNADYLLLIDAPLKSTEESVFLPSKLIDYIGSYNPVIGITPLKGASANVLMETGNLVCDIHDNDCICITLKRLINGSISERTKKEKVDKYHYKNVSYNFSKIIEQVKG